MDKPQNREDYMKALKEFSETVILNEGFMEKLKQHKYFKDTMPYIEEFESEETKKVCILLELTRTRESCGTVIEVLRESGQPEAADALQIYNLSTGTLLFENLSYDVEIVVNRAVIPLKDNMTLPYKMLSNPRGKFIIINNIPELPKETKRFKHVFEKLYFTPESHDNQTVEGIKTILSQFSNPDQKIENYDAFAFMIVTHGKNEKVLGFDACREDNDPQRNDNDFMNMSEIVNLINVNCLRMGKNKPKIVIFDCCRIRTDEELEFDFNAIQWIDTNEDTFVIYSCSKGEETFYFRIHEITAFGQCLSHAIAHYACYQNLDQIMAYTCSIMKELENTQLYSKPERRALFGTQEINFNVGHAINRIETSSHWFFDFSQWLFKKTIGRFCNHRNQNFVFFSTILFFIMYSSKNKLLPQ